MESWLRPATRPLIHYADFRGRSTRTELIAFSLLVLFAGTFLTMAASLVSGDTQVTPAILQLAILCPCLALWVRRLHDTGRSGWWLLLLLPSAAAFAWRAYRSGFSLDPYYDLLQPLPMAITIIEGCCLLALLVLLLWKDEEGANRYGPNPRHDEPAVETLGPA